MDAFFNNQTKNGSEARALSPTESRAPENMIRPEGPYVSQLRPHARSSLRNSQAFGTAMSAPSQACALSLGNRSRYEASFSPLRT